MGGASPVKDLTRRPRDRGLQIALNARELFTAHGYHSVRMDQIAEASGITARASIVTTPTSRPSCPT